MTKIYDALRSAEAERATGRAAEPRGAAEPTAPAANGELDQIRALLVGGLPELLEETVARLSAKLSEEAASLRADLDRLEAKLDSRIAEIETRAKQGHHELRDQVLSQSKLLADSIQERGENVIQYAVRSVNELGASKVDHSDFARFLRHTADHFARTASGESDGEGGPATIAVE